MNRSSRHKSDSTIGGSLAVPVAWFLIAVISAGLIVLALAFNRNFWFDEAMLLQAIRDEPFLPPGEPLANF